MTLLENSRKAMIGFIDAVYSLTPGMILLEACNLGSRDIVNFCAMLTCCALCAGGRQALHRKYEANHDLPGGERPRLPRHHRSCLQLRALRPPDRRGQSSPTHLGCTLSLRHCDICTGRILKGATASPERFPARGLVASEDHLVLRPASAGLHGQLWAPVL